MALLRKNKEQNAKEQTFVDHLEALRWHLIRMVLAILIFSIVAFIYIGEIFDNIILAPTKKDFPSYKLLCKLGEWFHMPELCMNDVNINFQNTQLSGQFMMSFSSAFMFGFIAAFPYIVWELWCFVKPALNVKEIKNAKGIIFWVSLLFFLGVAFGYFIIAPYTVSFFAQYKLSEQFENIIKIDDYLSTLTSLVLGTGLVFELPVLVYFLSRIGLLTPSFLRTYRKYAIVLILFVAAIITPPDVLSQIIVTIPLWILYEISIVLSARVQKRLQKEF